MIVLYAIIALAALLILIIPLYIRNKSVKVMRDKIIRCPFCRKEMDAAYIEKKMAMERTCPSCGRIIGDFPPYGPA